MASFPRFFLHLLFIFNVSDVFAPPLCPRPGGRGPAGGADPAGGGGEEGVGDAH